MGTAQTSGELIEHLNLRRFPLAKRVQHYEGLAQLSFEDLHTLHNSLLLEVVREYFKLAAEDDLTVKANDKGVAEIIADLPLAIPTEEAQRALRRLPEPKSQGVRTAMEAFMQTRFAKAGGGQEDDGPDLNKPKANKRLPGMDLKAAVPKVERKNNEIMVLHVWPFFALCILMSSCDGCLKSRFAAAWDFKLKAGPLTFSMINAILTDAMIGLATVYKPDASKRCLFDSAVLRRWYMQLFMLDPGGNLSVEDWVKLCGQCTVFKKFLETKWSSGEKGSQVALWQPDRIIQAMQISGEFGKKNAAPPNKLPRGHQRLSQMVTNFAAATPWARLLMRAPGKSDDDSVVARAGKRVTMVVNSVVQKLNPTKNCDSIIPEYAEGRRGKGKQKGAGALGFNGRASNLDVVFAFQLYVVLQRKWRFKAREFVEDRQKSETEILAELSNYLTTDESMSGDGSFRKMKLAQIILPVVHDDLERCLLQEQEFRWFLSRSFPQATEADLTRFEDHIRMHPELKNTYADVSNKASTTECNDELIQELRKPELPPEEVEAIREIWAQVDEDNVGSVSCKELHRRDDEDTIMYADYDLDGDKRLEFEDYLAICCPPTHHTKSSVWHIVARRIRHILTHVFIDPDDWEPVPVVFEQDPLLATLPNHAHSLFQQLYKDLDWDASDWAARSMGGFIASAFAERKSELQNPSKLTFDEFEFFVCPEQYKRNIPSPGRGQSQTTNKSAKSPAAQDRNIVEKTPVQKIAPEAGNASTGLKSKRS